MLRPIVRTCVCTAVLAGALGVSGGGGATSIPPGFTDSLVAGVTLPTALAFTPDGRMLVTQQSGLLRVYANGSLLPTPALNLSGRICSASEQGLLGVAVDPAFGTNRAIYLYYSASVGGGSCVNRVSRFVLSNENTVDPMSETILINNILSRTNHNGGDLNFGKDGYLYVSVGDGGSGSAARVESHLLGKILRITRDGGIPPDNPFQGAGTGRCNTTGQTTAARCQETFAWGLRNPFRFGFDPNAAGTRFFINDVGENAYEEIDLGQPGADYGWNVREGPCAFGSSNCGPPPAGMTNPIFSYPHTTGCTVITGGAFVPIGVWPPEYDGDYLYGDFECDKIGRLEPSGSPAAPDFATGLGSAVHLRFGPWAGPFGQTQALYYTTYASSGQVRRIGYTAGPPRTPQPPPSPPPGGPPPGTNPSPPATPAVRITAIRYDAPGADGRAARSLNGEWIRLRNFAGRRVALRGWTIRDAQGHVYRFRRYVLAAGSAVTVHTGPGRNTAAHRYWGRAAHVWGNTRDRATLRAATGAVADVCRYANRRANLKRC